MSRRRRPVRTLTTAELAEALGVRPRIVQVWAQDGCPHRVERGRPGHGPLRFDLHEVRTWLKAKGLDPRYPMSEALRPVTSQGGGR